MMLAQQKLGRSRHRCSKNFTAALQLYLKTQLQARKDSIVYGVGNVTDEVFPASTSADLYALFRAELRTMSTSEWVLYAFCELAMDLSGPVATWAGAVVVRCPPHPPADGDSPTARGGRGASSRRWWKCL